MPTSVRWEQEWRGYVAYIKHRQVGWVTEVGTGWDARTTMTDLGVYLTREMAQGAVTGMLRIERRGW